MEAPRPQWGELFGTHRDQLSSTNQLSGCLISPRKRFLYKGVMGKRVGSRSRWMERAILWSWSPWTPVGSPKDGTGGVGLAAPCCSERSPVFPLAWVISKEGKLRAAGGVHLLPEGPCPWPQTTKQGTSSRRQKKVPSQITWRSWQTRHHLTSRQRPGFNDISSSTQVNNLTGSGWRRSTEALGLTAPSWEQFRNTLMTED